jgi:hypothetical protein
MSSTVCRRSRSYTLALYSSSRWASLMRARSDAALVRSPSYRALYQGSGNDVHIRHDRGDPDQLGPDDAQAADERVRRREGEDEKSWDASYNHIADMQ